MKQFFCHLFLPHHSNNHRAKFLHHSSIFFLILFLFVVNVSFGFIHAHFPQVLGASVDVSSQDLLLLTNQKREESHKAPLVLNSALTNAAKAKASDMLAKDYWAHVSPDGTLPWKFFKESGYEYVYAGENLARGFSSSPEVVSAWMASPTHRENMLSDNYKEVGFAIVSGKLQGEDTTLIVEMLGNTTESTIAKATAPSSTKQESGQNVLPLSTNMTLTNSLKVSSLINEKSLGTFFAVGLICFFIFLFVLDIFVIQRKKIVRHVGHTIDHIAFFAVILLVILMSQGGIVL